MKIVSSPIANNDIFNRVCPIDKPQTSSIKFRGLISADIFEKASISNPKCHIKELYNRISREIGIVSAQEIKNVALNISKKTSVDLLNVYSILNTLTNYSSYKSLEHLSKAFEQMGVKSISDLSLLLPAGVSDFPPTLNHALNYILRKNCPNIGDEWDGRGNRAVILDSKLLDYIEKIPSNLKPKFEKYLNSSKTKLVYLKNFENSYNILNQGKDFETYTVDLINKAKNLSGDNILKNVERILDEDNLAKIKKLSLNVNIINPQKSKNLPIVIAEKINPIVPDETFFSEYIKNAFNKSDIKEQEKIEKCISEFLNKTLFVVSSQNYAKYIKVLNKKINEFVLANNKDLNNIYYLIPHNRKSFVLTSYVYQKVNNINNSEQIYPTKNFIFEDDYKLSSLPKNSTIIVLDDCSISGLSLLDEVFDYKNVAKESLPENLSIILAPMLITEKGKENIEKCINKYRKGSDALIYAETIPTFDNVFSKENTQYLKIKSDNNYTTSLLLPYMGPDTNLATLVPFYDKFFINPIAQKIPVDNLDFFLKIQ